MSQSSREVSAQPIYVLRGVERTYMKGGVTVQAVRGIDLEVAQGEMVALEGPSGSGKTTLLQLLGALDSPTRGTINFAGNELSQAGDGVLTKLRSEAIGFVFQHFNLIPTLSAEDNVAIAMIPQGVSRERRVARARELLGQVGLEPRLAHLPSRLSGGEQQRVAIARALANAPRVVIADEPTGNLDSTTANEVMELLSELHQRAGITVIIATHDEDVARRCDRRVHLRDGRVVDN